MRTISVPLSSDGIKKLEEELMRYAKAIPQKNEKFIELLSKHGIRAAQEALADGSHRMPERITLIKEVEVSGNNVTLTLSGEGATFTSIWTDRMGDEHADVVYPMHMMEFGSAAYALDPSGDYGATAGGKGTFSTMGHEDEYSWYINVGTADEPELKFGTAIYPTRPLYHAMEEMRSQVLKAAKEAFGGG